MSSVTQNAACLIVNISSIGTARKVPTNHVTVDAEEKLIKVSKSLLSSPQLSAIKSLDGEGRKAIYNMCIASKIIKSGVYLVPLANVQRVDDYLSEWRSRRNVLVNDLASVYPALVAADQQALRAEFEYTDYPGCEYDGEVLTVDGDALRAEFSMHWQYVSFETPSNLKNVSDAFFQREQEKAQVWWSEMNQDVKTVLREQLAELVNHMADKLAGKDDGKPKIFRNTMVENMNEFLSMFDAKNIASDSQLAGLVQQAKNLMHGVVPDALRKNEGLRDSVKSGFDKIKANLDTMLADKPKRQLYFDDFAPVKLPTVKTEEPDYDKLNADHLAAVRQANGIPTPIQ